MRERDRDKELQCIRERQRGRESHKLSETDIGRTRDRETIRETER